jgi:hypothetical protein
MIRLTSLCCVSGVLGAAALLVLGCEVRHSGHDTGTGTDGTTGGSSSASSSSSSSSSSGGTGDPGTSAPDCGPIPLAEAAQGIGGFIMDGEGSGHELGFSVSHAGDMNGDGRADLVVAARDADPNGPGSGRSYAVFGKTDTDPVSPTGVAAGNGGFVIDGEAEDHYAGTSVSGAGDVDGDGLDDVVVGAPYASPNDVERAGRGYVIWGKATTLPVQLAQVAQGQGGFVMNGEQVGANTGFAVSGAGDVNGDGLADVILGAPNATTNGSDSGRTYVVLGKANNTGVALSDVAAGIGGFALDGEVTNDRSGHSVRGAGDVNGDGLADLIVGAAGASPNGPDSGRTYVVFGKVGTEGVLLANVTGGTGGFAIDGELPGDMSGHAVSNAGDVNADGLDDIVVSAPSASPRGTHSGRTYVVFGREHTARVLLSNVADGIGGFAIDGEAGDHRSGHSVSGVGDMNGDGYADFIVGAPGASPNGGFSGRTYVVYGKPSVDIVLLSDVTQGIGGFALDGEDFEHFSGVAVGGGNDVNGDGRPDILIGAPLAAPSEQGRAYLVFGSDLSCAGR